MGYTTEFNGGFYTDKPVTNALREYLCKFSETRRMMRDPEKIKEIYPNWKDLCFNGQLGEYGELFTVNDNCFGQSKDDSILNYNSPAPTQPGLWCDWECNLVGKDNGEDAQMCKIEWNGSEKFYYYVKWLEYIIETFLKPSGISINGAALAVGEELGDAVYILVDDNRVTTIDAMDEYAFDWTCKVLGYNDVLMKEFENIFREPDEIRDENWDYYDDDEE